MCGKKRKKQKSVGKDRATYSNFKCTLVINSRAESLFAGSLNTFVGFVF